MRSSSWAKAVLFSILLSTSAIPAGAGESLSINPYPFQDDAAKQAETDQVPVETLQAVGAIRARMNRTVLQEVEVAPPPADMLEAAPPPEVAYTPEEPELEPDLMEEPDEPAITYTYEEPEDLDDLDEPEIQPPEMAYTPPPSPSPAVPRVIVEPGAGAADDDIEISVFEELPQKPKPAPAPAPAAAAPPPMEEQLLSMQPAEAPPPAPMQAREIAKPLAIYTPHDPLERWQVAQGADVRSTLSAWSREAGVQLLWAADDQFMVLQSFTLQGAYEDAVQTLLDQYMTDAERPVGSLHVDPDTGEKVLVIESYSQS